MSREIQMKVPTVFPMSYEMGQVTQWGRLCPAQMPSLGPASLGCYDCCLLVGLLSAETPWRSQSPTHSGDGPVRDWLVQGHKSLVARSGGRTSAVRSMLLALPPWTRQKTTQVHSFSRLLHLLYSAPFTPLNIFFLPEEQSLSKSCVLESWSQAPLLEIPAQDTHLPFACLFQTPLSRIQTWSIKTAWHSIHSQ